MKRLIQKSIGALLLAIVAVTAVAQAPAAYTKPKVRAITAFVRLDRATYAQQIAETLAVIRSAKSEFEKQGYEIETLRIVTQPLAELVSGQSDADALKFLKAFDDLSVKESFLPSVGPAMMRDSDDPKTMHLLAQMLSALPNINANAIMAGDDGIHWKVIRETAALIRYVTDHSVHSQGNFNFTGTAMLKPLGPFYPGTFHTGAGKQFSLGFEGANVVREVFARTHGDFNASVTELTKQLTVHSKIGESIGEKVAAATGWAFMGVDPTPAPRGRFHRNRHGSLHRREVWLEWNTDRGPGHHHGGQGRAGEADRLLRPDGPGDGGQGARETLGRRDLQHRRPPGLFGRLWHRTRHDSAAW